MTNFHLFTRVFGSILLGSDVTAPTTLIGREKDRSRPSSRRRRRRRRRWRRRRHRQQRRTYSRRLESFPFYLIPIVIGNFRCFGRDELKVKRLRSRSVKSIFGPKKRSTSGSGSGSGLVSSSNFGSFWSFNSAEWGEKF